MFGYWHLPRGGIIIWFDDKKYLKKLDKQGNHALLRFAQYCRQLSKPFCKRLIYFILSFLTQIPLAY